MYHRDYVRKTLLKCRDSRENSFYCANISGLISFLLISIVIAPLFHEIMHLTVLEYLHCNSNTNIEISWEYGIHGDISPLCALSGGKAALLFGAGFVGNFIIASAFFMFTSFFYRRDMLLHSNFLMYVALGFLTDPLFYFFASEGDIASILKILGREDWLPILPAPGILMFSLSIAYIYCYLGGFLEEQLRMEKEVKEAEDFIEEIKR
ncbi:MAG: hypothetical protein JW724_07190 [Candidatus Altiarchaeota archaeon]|nr:hypothetical protein [Candidatus Altiarchaeota archaeon]